MQTFEFSAIAQNGFIKIPDEYVNKVGPIIRVVLYTDNKPEKDVSSERPSLLALAGIFKGCKDMDVKEIREERRKKYENPA